MKVIDLFLYLAFGGAALFAYDKYKSELGDATPPQVVPTAQVAHAAVAEDRSWIKPRDSQSGSVASSSSKCDGRTSCPQMTSCSEATYFIQHCPGTKMDGDGDGIACEDQWCR